MIYLFLRIKKIKKSPGKIENFALKMHFRHLYIEYMPRKIMEICEIDP